LTNTTKILNVIYGIIVLLFLADTQTHFDIKSQGLKSFVYVALLIGTPLILLWNILVIQLKTKRIIGTVFPAIILVFILIAGPLKIFFSTGTWNTQTILYQNGHLSFKTIEFQMQDLGPLGYKKRTVEVLYVTPLFILTREIPKDIERRVEWIKVDKEINELGLKFP
jgi:hypothetical protein